MKTWIKKLEDLDIVAVPLEITERAQTWSQGFIGLTTLLDVEFDHEDGEDIIP